LTWLMELGWIKSMGGVYLLYMSGKFFLAKKAAEPKRTFSEFAFWRTVVAVELMDIAFSLDSVLAAVSISQNYFIVISGAILGIIMMRFAASIFIGLVARFPKLEETAYLLIAIVGLKLFIQGFNFEGVDFHSSQNIFAWAFWLFMAFALMLGFRSVERNNISNAQSTES